VVKTILKQNLKYNHSAWGQLAKVFIYGQRVVSAEQAMPNYQRRFAAKPFSVLEI